ncbi:ribokinase [Microbacterium thalassium]|uniref:ribokinase n=1 Tax=Microbacterium TaxID=33882 RepID=UPI00146C450E|nr:ribokinase [Microbacterium thalassium]
MTEYAHGTLDPGLRPGRVAVLGSLNLDLVVTCAVAPGPGETRLASGYEEHPGGKGANQAIGAARITRTYLIGAAGDDNAGRRIENALRSSGVRTAHVRTVGALTGRAVITVRADGENSILVVQGANLHVSAEQVLASLDQIRPDVVVAQLEIPISAIEAARRWADEHGRRWILNPSPTIPVPGDLIHGADPLIANEHEARMVLDLHGIETKGDLHVLARRLLQLVRSVVITAGAEGALVADADHPDPQVVPSPRVTPVDTTGAGDEFAGSLAAQLACGQDLLSASIASAGAASRLITTPRGHRLPPMSPTE